MAWQPTKTTRAWLEGMAVSVTTIICFFGFWRLSPGITLIIACLALIVLVALLWREGGRLLRPESDA